MPNLIYQAIHFDPHTKQYLAICLLVVFMNCFDLLTCTDKGSHRWTKE